jgi:hypothetical protein
MRYMNLLFLLFSDFYIKERTQQSLWESGKVPLLFAELFHFSIGLRFTDFYPQIPPNNQKMLPWQGSPQNNR